MPGEDTNKASNKKEPLVYALSRASRCFGCDLRLLENEIIQLKNEKDDREVYCRKCSGLEGLEVLLSGNATVTRLAKKYSSIKFVIVKWSDTWKCYERKGLLVEKQALERAQKEAALR